jgi:hypothetical protein
MKNPLIARRSLLLLPLLGMPGAWCAQGDGAAQPRPPAPTLKPSSPVPLRVDSRGFIRRWRVQEPIAVSGRLTQTEVEKLLSETPWTASASNVAHALDTTGYNFNLYHFAWALSKPTSNVLFWVNTLVDVPADLINVRLAIGSNAASAWWIDDERVISLYNDRQSVIDDGVSRRLQLSKGRHIIRAAIINGGGATDFCARFLDDDGRPVTTLSTTPTPAL